MEATQPLTAPGLTAAPAGTRALDPAQRVAHRADIDGLRAIAVAIVVGFHCGIPWLPGGFVGVDVFFVISGFLIGGILYDEATTGRFSYGKFYARRIRRIAPALVAVIAATTLIALAFLSPQELKDFATYAIGALMSVPNIVFLKTTNYFAGSADLNPLLMTWSLGVEEQFYLFYPPLLLLLLRWKSRLLPAIFLLSLASFALNVWSTATHPALAFYALPPRAWELGVGVFLAIWQSRQRQAATPSMPATPPAASSRLFMLRQVLAAAGIAMIAGSALFFDNTLAFPGVAALLPVMGSLLVIANDGPVNRFVLGSRPLVFVGLISYSWYLWHWPLLSFARVASDFPLTWRQGVVISTLSFVISVFSYRHIETPFRRGWQGVSTKRWIVGYLAVVGVCVLVLLGVRQSNGMPSRVPASIVAIEREAGAARTDTCLLSYGDVAPRTGADCLAPAGAGAVVALMGDSHASALRAGAEDFARRSGMGFTQLTKSSCPTLVDVSRVMSKHPRHFDECARFNRQALDRVMASPEVKVVILAGFWYASIYEMSASQGYQSTVAPRPFTRTEGVALLSQGLSRTVDELSRKGKRVIVIDDTPLLGFDPIKHLVTARMPTRRFVGDSVLGNLVPDGDRSSFVLAADDDVRRAVAAAAYGSGSAVREGVSLYSLRDRLCEPSGCRFAEDGRPMLFDQHHLSQFGARTVFSGLK
jgi:peptidoglycan/LPS O-acetylase OafA/YrhL